MSAPASRDPVLGIIYGVPKTGKTTDLGYSFPRAVWAAAPGATASLESVCGYKPFPRPVDIPDLGVGITLIEKVSAEKPGEFDAIIIDDLSLYVDRTVRSLAKQGVGVKDPRQLWGAVRMKLLDLRDTARRARLHVFLNAHESGPKMQNMTRIRGGPALPGAGAELVPAACDVVLRAAARAEDPTAIITGWPVTYRCQVQDLDYVSGDRYNRTPDYSPMNIGELLRSSGFVIRRLPGLEWQEPIVEKIAGALVQNIGDRDFVKKALDLAFDQSMRYAKDEKHAIWVQRDAYDRAVLKIAQAKHQRRLF
jgi:hypothetical protein